MMNDAEMKMCLRFAFEDLSFLHIQLYCTVFWRRSVFTGGDDPVMMRQ
jgi:hypothetical protein